MDAGIARAALDDAAAFVTTKSRPYPDAIAAYDVERHADDPLVVRAFGEMELAVRAARGAAAEAAARSTGRTRDLTAQTAGEASLAVAAARAATTAASVEVGIAALRGRRHPLGARPRSTSTGTGATPAPTPCTTRPSWKVQHLGRYAVDGTLPPNHGQL